MTYAEFIDNGYSSSNDLWNNFQHSSASGSFDINSPRWFENLERKLNTFRALQENWDSYGGYPIDEGALEHAKQFLNSTLFASLGIPFVAPTSTGGVHVEWEINNKALEFEFVSLTELHYYYSDSSAEREGELHSDFEDARIAAREFIE